MKTKTTFPLEIVTGLGLGISYSSYAQVGSVLPATGVGETNLRCYTNIATGNLIVFDTPLVIDECNFPLKLQYIYNSQAGNPAEVWHFAHKQFKAPFKAPFPPQESMVLIEEDGHETTYTLSSSSERATWFPPYCQEGRPFLQYSQTYEQWVLFNPKTQVTEYYDAEGLLTSRADPLNRETTYTYQTDAPFTLKSITGPSGNTYTLTKKILSDGGYEQTCTLQTPASAPLLLRTWTFDSKQRLSKTTLLSLDNMSAPFVIDYSYDVHIEEEATIDCIQQSDASIINFAYKNTDLMRLTEVSLGKTPASIIRQFRFDEEKNAYAAIGQDGVCTYFSIDKDYQLTQLTKHAGIQGFDLPDITTVFTYKDNLLESITHPGGGLETFTYQTVNGTNFYALVEKHALPEKRDITYFYDASHHYQKMNEVHTLDDKTEIIHRDIFDYDTPCVGQTHGTGTALRFTISPEGRVCEYRYDTFGHLQSKRLYLEARFLTPTPPEAMIPVQVLEQWSAKQDASKVALTTYKTNNLGQITETKTFAQVDAKGNGIDSPENSLINTTEDIYGNLLESKVLQSLSLPPAITTYTVDALARPLTITNPLQQLTTQTYDTPVKEGQIAAITTHPNGRKDRLEKNSQGIIVKKQAEVLEDGVTKTRTTSITYAKQGVSCWVETFTNGLQQFSYYDRLGALSFTVSAQGIVTHYLQDENARFKSITTFAKTINPADLSLDGMLSVALLAQAIDKNGLLNDPDNVTTYTFFDSANRVHYTVNADMALTETFYDTLSNDIGSIHYAKALTEEQLTTLKKGESLQLPLDPTIDRCQRCIYDKDSLLIAEQDAAGFVKTYQRNSAGWVVETTVFRNPVAIQWEQPLTYPAPDNKKDAHSYTFYNNKGNPFLSVDAEGYVTTQSYLANGLVDKSRRFAERLPASWFDKPFMPPILPLKSQEDKVLQYVYDDLDRIVKILHVNDNKQELTTYSVQGEITFQATADDNVVLALEKEEDLGKGKAKDKEDTPITGDNYRAIRYAHDGFGQMTAKTSPLLAIIMAQVELSTTLTPAQKTQLMALLWQHFSQRFVHDDAGLMVQTITSSADINNLPLTDITADKAFDTSTYIYYDNQERAFLRFTPLAQDRVLIEEASLDSFDNSLSTRRYAQVKKAFPSEKIAALTGGLLPQDLQTLLLGLQDNDNDPITHNTYNKSGARLSHTDAENYPTTFIRNTFNECTEEQRCIKDTKPSLFIKQTFDTRGLVSEYSEEAEGAEKVLIQKTFRHPKGLCTQMTKALGLQTLYHHDRLNREIANEATVEGVLITHSLEWDSFNRCITKTDPLKLTTLYSYHRAKREEVIVYPLDNVCETLGYNPFGEKIKKTDALENTWQFTHTSTGQLASTMDPMLAKTALYYNLFDKNIAEENALGLQTVYELDGLGKRMAVIQGVGSDQKANLPTTTFTRNALNLVSSIESPTTTITKRVNNKKGLVIEETIDPKVQGLQLLATFTHNGQGQVDQQTKGSVALPKQQTKTQLHDPLARPLGETIDPEGLNITHTTLLNAAGQSVALINPMGAITWQIYNTLGQKRFEISPVGGVKAWSYDKNGQIIQATTYANALTASQLKTLTTHTTPSDIKALIKPAPTKDASIYYFYDACGRERFEVNVLWESKTVHFEGIVIEKQYDNASRPIKKIHYAQTIPAANIAEASLESIEQLVTTIKQPTADAVTWQCFDAAGRLRFTIDAENYLHEIRYDALNQPIIHVDYALVQDPEALSKIPVNEILGQAKQDVTLDRTTYRFYDAFQRCQFEINGEGCVLGFSYDKAGNRIQECRYQARLYVPEQYDALIKILEAYIPNPSTDRITHFTFDAANRLTGMKDPMGFEEHYLLDALGNRHTFIDKMQSSFLSAFDKANREWQKTTPKITVTSIKALANGNLICIGQEAVALVTEKVFNKENNITQQTFAKGATDERTVLFRYDDCGRITGTERQNVPIDNNTPLRIGYRPETLTTLFTAVRYNSRGQKIATMDESNAWTFYVRDNLGRLVYTIKPNGATVYKERDTQGRVLEKTEYATAFIPAFPLLEGAIDVQKVADFFAMHTSPDDRTTVYYRDKKGNITAIEKGSVYNYIPGKVDQKLPLKRYAATQNFIFNAFNQIESHNTWINSDELKIDQTWFDRTGAKRFQTQSQGLPTEANCSIDSFTTNSFGEVIATRQVATPIPQGETADATLATLSDWVKAHETPLDRHRGIEYNGQGKPTKEISYKVTRQELILDANGIPSLHDESHESLTTAQHAYDGLGRITCTTFADGSLQARFYDACNQIAQTEVTQRNAGLSTPVTPLTYFDHNSHGQVARTTRFKTGTTSPINLKKLPQPLKLDDKYDICDMHLYDNRGKVTITQSGKQNTKAFTYMTSGQISRSFNKITNWKQSPTNQSLFTHDAVHIDSKAFVYDNAGLAIQERLSRDNVVVYSMHTDYNLFNQSICRYINPQDKQDITKYDTLGNPWFAMKSGVPTVFFYNFIHQEVYAADSPVIGKIESLTYASLSEVLDLPYTVIERTEKQRDLQGQLKTVAFPAGLIKDKEVSPTIDYTHDRFNNIIKIKDLLTNETDYAYNDADARTSEQLPPVDAVDAHGQITKNFRTKTQYGHNITNKPLGESWNLANGSTKTEAWVYDAANPIVFILADGTKARTQLWNPLGQIYQEKTPTSETFWENEHDDVGNLVSHTSPMKYTTTWKFNEVRSLISNTMPIRNAQMQASTPTWRYNRDAAGNISDSFLPLGNKTSFVHDINHTIIQQINPDKKKIDYKRDFYSRLSTMTDLSNGVTTFTYNGKKQEVLRIRSGGEPASYIEFQIIKELFTFYRFNKIPYGPINQHLLFSYAMGQRTGYEDKIRGLKTTYTLNLAGLTEGLQIVQIDKSTQKETLLLDRQSLFDTLGRENRTSEGPAVCTLGFDDEDNRRYLQMAITFNGKTTTESLWWGYNTLNQVTLCGPLVGGNITPELGKGFTLSYTGLLRTGEHKIILPFPLFTSLKYDDDGRIYNTSYSVIKDSPLPHEQLLRKYNDRGFLESYTDTNPKLQRALTYDDNGAIHTDIQALGENIGKKTNQITTTFHRDEISGLLNTHTTDYGDSAKTLDTCTYAYYYKEHIALKSISTLRKQGPKKIDNSTATTFLGPSGEMNAITNVGNSDSNGNENKFFLSTPEGLVLERDTINIDQKLGGYDGKRFFHNSQGVPLGDIAFSVKDSLRTLLSWIPALQPLPATLFGSGLSFHTNHSERIRQSSLYSLAKPHSFNYQEEEEQQRKLKNVKEGKGKRPLYGKNPITDENPTLYAVINGDDYKGIAKKIFGDESLADMISLANGGQPLAHGQTISIPHLIPSHNKSSDAIPYQLFVSIIQGNIYSFVKTPPPPKPHHSFFKELVSLLTVAVAVILAAPSGGTSLGLLGLGTQVANLLNLAGGISELLITGVVAGMADAALQGFLVGFGAKEFSITEAISAGFAAASPGFLSPAAKSASPFLETAVRAASMNITEQLTFMAIGKQPHFDFTQAGAALLGSTINPQLAKIQGFPQPIVHAMQTISNAAVTGVLRGNFSVENLGALLVSNAIAEAATPVLIQGLVWADKHVFNQQAERRMALNYQPAPKVKAKQQGNARKDNIHHAEIEHYKSFIPSIVNHPDFVKKLPDVPMDLMPTFGNFEEDKEAAAQLLLEPLTDIPNPPSFMDYVDAFNHGVEAGRDGVVRMLLHPLDTAFGVAQMSFDGYNAITDLTLGVSTQGSRERNALRSAQINETITNFSEGNGAIRLGMITEAMTSTILTSGVAGVAAKAIPLASKAAISASTTAERLGVGINKSSFFGAKQPVIYEINASQKIIQESRNRSLMLQEKYAFWDSSQRLARIDELSQQNYSRRLVETFDKQEYVFRYLSEDGLKKSLYTGSVSGYTTTIFSHTAKEISRGAQILPEWGPPQYGVAIPTNKLNGFQLARPLGNQEKIGWEVYTNSYPKAGAGGWTQFLANPVDINEVHIFRLSQ